MSTLEDYIRQEHRFQELLEFLQWIKQHEEATLCEFHDYGSKYDDYWSPLIVSDEELVAAYLREHFSPERLDQAREKEQEAQQQEYMPMDSEPMNGYSNTFTYHAGRLLMSNHAYHRMMDELVVTQEDDGDAAETLKDQLEVLIEDVLFRAYEALAGQRTLELGLLHELANCAMNQVNWRELIERHRRHRQQNGPLYT